MDGCSNYRRVPRSVADYILPLLFSEGIRHFSCRARGPKPNPSQGGPDKCTRRTSGEVNKLWISPRHPYLCDFKDRGVKAKGQYYSEWLGTFVVAECGAHRQQRERFSMRTLNLTVTVFAFVQGGIALAQQGDTGATIEPTPIEKVLDANPEPDGKAYRIEILLKEGTRVAYRIPPSEAAKIADGMSKPAIAGGQDMEVATIVSGMIIQIDSKGKAVILTPRSQSGVLEPLAIPISGAKLLVRALKTKIAEAKATAAKQQKRP
jgi:hypothetical protein